MTHLEISYYLWNCVRDARNDFSIKPKEFGEIVEKVKKDMLDAKDRCDFDYIINYKLKHKYEH